MSNRDAALQFPGIHLSVQPGIMLGLECIIVTTLCYRQLVVAFVSKV